MVWETDKVAIYHELMHARQAFRTVSFSTGSAVHTIWIAVENAIGVIEGRARWQQTVAAAREAGAAGRDTGGGE